jgi:hypothetical protein
MPRKERKYHYIYKITCLKNNRYYIGMHSTDNLEDGYMGGGKRIKNSVKRYGKNFHIKEIIEFLENREMLAEREKDIINQELINDPLCLNLCTGGHYYDRGWTDEDRLKASNRLKELNKDSEWTKNHSKKIINGLKESLKKEGLKSFLNKNHSEATKKKMSESSKGKGLGNNNSQFGKIWIYNDNTKENKKINPIDYFLFENNWNKGLKMEYFKK